MTKLTHITTDDTVAGDLTGNPLAPVLVATGVTAGTYTNPTLAVDAKGRVTSAANGTGGTGNTTDLADSTVGAPGALQAGKTNNVTAAGTYTAPTPDAAVATPPKRFAIFNQTTGPVTLSFPNISGTTISLTVLAGEVVTFRQKSNSGYANESGNKPLAQLDARYVQPAALAPVATSGSYTDLTNKPATYSPTDASTSAKGVVQLAGDLAGTAAAPTVPGLATKEPAITAGTTSQYYRGDKTFQTLNKAAVGLANVDNTADTAKPVSTAQQSALDAKQATLVSGTNIKTVNGTTLLGSGDLVISGGGGASDATTTSKGIVQLAGDLGGTAASPTVTIGLARDYNLVINPSFEVDYTGWTNYGVYGSITRDSATPFSGTYSSKHTNSSASDGGMISSAFTLNPGNYIFSVYARMTSDVTNACMVVRGSGQTSGVVTQINQAYPGNANWNRYTGNITIATQGTYEVLLGQGSYGSASTGSVNYDAVMLTLATANQTYFDGSLTSTATTTYSWTGTAHASTSLRVSPSRLINSDYLPEGVSNLFFTTDRAAKTGSSVLSYWDGTVDPTVTGQSYPLATLGGNAAYVAGSGVRLTQNINNQSGQIYWDFVQAPFMRVQYNFMAAPDPGGADATWFYCFANANPTTEYGSGGFTKGYLVYISEYSGRIGLAYGNFNDGTQNQSGMGAALKPLVSTTLAATSIVNGQFNNVDVTIRYNRIVVRFNGTVLIDYTDIYTRDLSNTKFGFGSRTGGSNNNHYIKGLVVAKLGQDLNEYGIQSRIDDTTKTYVDAADATKQPNTVTQAIQTANFTPASGGLYPVNATSAAITATLPTSTAGQIITIIKNDNSANFVNVTGNINGVTNTTINFKLLNEEKTFVPDGSGGWWVASGNFGLTSLDARFQASLTLTTTGTSGAATLSGGTLNIPQYSGGSGSAGITRSIINITAAVTGAAAALTDYVYYWSGSTAYTFTLPTAASNTDRYTLKNTSTITQTVATTASQTIDGSTGATLTANTSLELISNGTNWMVI